MRDLRASSMRPSRFEVKKRSPVHESRIDKNAVLNQDAGFRAIRVLGEPT